MPTEPVPVAESVADVIGKVLRTLVRFPGTEQAVNPHEVIETLRSAGYVIVPAKTSYRGPRAQVITPSDGVLTREGEILAVALHAAEERELDLLAKIGRLERQIDGPKRMPYPNDCESVNCDCAEAAQRDGGDAPADVEGHDDIA